MITSRPSRDIINEVLPAPEPPMIAVNLPARITPDTSLTRVVCPLTNFTFLKSIVTSNRLRAAAAAAAAAAAVSPWTVVLWVPL